MDEWVYFPEIFCFKGYFKDEKTGGKELAVVIGTDLIDFKKGSDYTAEDLLEILIKQQELRRALEMN